jgi:purine-binding chemotaxis protein CheW
LTHGERDAGLSLLCRVGSHLCALPIESVVETMRPLPLSALSGAPAFVLGLSIIRGSPIPVVDVRCLLSATDERGDPARFVTVKTGDRRTALAVDSVIGVRVLGSVSLGELPALLGEAKREVVETIGALDAKLLIVLESARMVPESLWADLEAGRPPP